VDPVVQALLEEPLGELLEEVLLEKVLLEDRGAR
jgi:hypothetical protein